MLGINATDEEVLKYGSTEEKLARFESILNDKPDHDAEIKQLGKDYERMEEAQQFASDLLAEIRVILAQETRAKDIKKAINLAFENSYHEE